MATAVSPQDIQPTRDSHSECALTVQHDADIVVEAIKSRGIMSSDKWANPLTAAPSAVSIMAILLKTASSSVAAGMPLQARAVRNSDGEKIGELESTLLHSSLQRCSDLGRSAFSEARKTMDYINKVALNMTQNKGKIENMLRMIEPSNDQDEDEDEDDLMDEIKDIRNSTSKCLEKIQKLTKDFHYWYCVICTVKESVLEGQGEIQCKVNQNEDDLKATTITQTEHTEHETTALQAIKELEVQLEHAKNKVKEAEKLTITLENLPLISETSIEEEVPLGNKKKAGIFDKVKGVKEKIKEKLKKRDEVRKEAERTLKRARECEERLQANLIKCREDLDKNRGRLASVRADLAKTEAQFERLRDTNIELTDILTILQHSAYQLGELKKHVQDLDTFFNSILNDITVTAEDDVENEFLRRIEKGIRPDTREVKLSKRMRERVRDSALRIQASFCAIRDISRVYVTISDRYINEAINQMEALSCLQGEEWEIKRRSFFEWCDKSMSEIDSLTEAVVEELDENMKERVTHLTRLTVEPTH